MNRPLAAVSWPLAGEPTAHLPDSVVQRWLGAIDAGKALALIAWGVASGGELSMGQQKHLEDAVEAFLKAADLPPPCDRCDAEGEVFQEWRVIEPDPARFHRVPIKVTCPVCKGARLAERVEGQPRSPWHGA